MSSARSDRWRWASSNAPGGGLRHPTEFVLVGLIPSSRTLTGVDLIAVPAVGPGTTGRYPTQKPDELGRVLARLANIVPGDMVLDPFVGSGALLVGARERGARVIGCDIAPAALRQARTKLSAAGTNAGPPPARSERAASHWRVIRAAEAPRPDRPETRS